MDDKNTVEVSGEPAGVDHGTAKALAAIGRQIRRIRKTRGMTLQHIADATGLSPSMLSLVERGLASPSLGSLILVTQALHISLSDLLSNWEGQETDIVVRGSDAQMIETGNRVKKFILKEDRARSVTITVDEYAPNTGSTEVPISHEGYEYCFILTGELTIEVDGVSHIVREGDLISYSSRRHHKIWNRTGKIARSLWFNIEDI